MKYGSSVSCCSQTGQPLLLFLIRQVVLGSVLMRLSEAVGHAQVVAVDGLGAEEFVTPIARCIWLAGALLKSALIVAIACVTSACNLTQSSEVPRTIQIHQSFQFQPGDRVADHAIVAGLGDISVELNGDSVYAPFSGRIQPNIPNCVLFSSPDIPAYLFRLCGLHNPRLGTIQQGEAIGSSAYLHFATLRKEEDGTWSMVEPARDILERLLHPTQKS